MVRLMDGLKHMNVYMNDEEIPYSHVYLLVCTKCGKFKQVKMKPGIINSGDED